MNKEELKLLKKLVRELIEKSNQKPTSTDVIQTVCTIVMALVAVLCFVFSLM
jgi:hypothetical protein